MATTKKNQKRIEHDDVFQSDLAFVFCLGFWVWFRFFRFAAFFFIPFISLFNDYDYDYALRAVPLKRELMIVAQCDQGQI